MNDPKPDVSEIHNFELLTEWLATSGQPTRIQFDAIASAGYHAVVNLALPSSDNSIADEGSVVTGHGMKYFHIPVKMENPTIDDLRVFFGVMNAMDGKNVWVHCVVNARVSAFAYHYLRYEKGVDDEAAKTKLLLKWEPQMDRTWREFLAIPREQIEGR